MADNTGWISLHRQIKNHWIWQDPIKFKWWIDILITVNIESAIVNIGYQNFECKRGESLLSLQSWANQWKVSKDTARNFLKLLEKEKMIKCVSIGTSTRLIVCNYDSYQTVLHVKKTASKRQANDTPTQLNNDNKNNKEKGDFDVLFDRWLNYKKDRRESYVSDDSRETAFKKLLKLSQNEIGVATEIIDEAIGNNWAGFFKLKTDNSAKMHNGKKVINQSENVNLFEV